MPKSQRLPKTTGWSRLDNAAKIFPANSTLRDAKVFRFSCQLREAVNPIRLQQALDRTLEDFPHYRSVLRRGLFWYFLEQSALPALVEEENLPLCSPLYNRDKRSLLFRVFYYHCRMSVEVYHALSDGSGVLQFQKTLLHHYLLLCHSDTLGQHPPLPEYDASQSQRMDDSFSRHYRGERMQESLSSVKAAKRAYKIQGPRLSEYRLRLIEGSMPVQPLLELARQKGTTLTVLLGAVLVQAIHEQMPSRMQQLPVVLSIPVNLRTYFKSQSARNFFGLFYASYNYSQGDGTLEDILEKLGGCFHRELTPQRLEVRMNELAALENNIFTRAIPLFLKDITLRIFGRRSEQQMTAAFSNLGRITLPEPLADYVETFVVSASTNKLQVCLSTFHDQLTVTMTQPFAATDIPMSFFRGLTQLGAQVTIATNLYDPPLEIGKGR